MKRAGIISCSLAHTSDVKRPKDAGKTPRRQHQPIDRPDVFGSEIIRGEGRHGAEPAAVTHQDNKSDNCHCRRRGDLRQEPKEQDLKNEHDGKCRAARYQVGDPRPKYATDAVAQARYSDHAAGHQRSNASELLKQRPFLRNQRNAGGSVQKQDQPKRPPLPALQRFAQDVVMRCALGGFFRTRSPSWRLVAFRRVLHEQRRDDRDD